MANNRFDSSGAFACARCHRVTRDTGNGEAEANLCRRCIEVCQWENYVDDGGDINQVPAEFRAEIQADGVFIGIVSKTAVQWDGAAWNLLYKEKNKMENASPIEVDKFAGALVAYATYESDNEKAREQDCRAEYSRTVEEFEKIIPSFNTDDAQYLVINGISYMLYGGVYFRPADYHGLEVYAKCPNCDELVLLDQSVKNTIRLGSLVHALYQAYAPFSKQEIFKAHHLCPNRPDRKPSLKQQLDNAYIALAAAQVGEMRANTAGAQFEKHMEVLKAEIEVKRLEHLTMLEAIENARS